MVVPVSVVIPFYNAVQYLPACLESVEKQSATPAEIIIVDDGSDQESSAYLENLDRHISVVRLERNCGPGVARNVAVRTASQPYIAFLDADDLWRPGKLESQYKFMEAWPELDATHTGACFFDTTRDISFNPGLNRQISIEAALTNYRLITPSIMMKRASFERIGGFDPKFRCTQDWEMHIRMVLAGFQIQLIPDVLVRVRRQNHGHHSSNWRCFLAGHTGIVFKHRREYINRLGRRAWIHQLAFELHRSGALQGGMTGRLLQIPFRIGI